MTNRIRSVVIAHPLQQHSYHLARALESSRSLLRYYTTVYYRPNTLLYRSLNRWLPEGNADRMRNRRSGEFDDRVRQFHDLIGLLYLFIIRLDHKKIVEPLLYGLLVRLFGRRVARDLRLDMEVGYLVMYDTTAYDCFMHLRRFRPDIVRVLDMSSAPAALIRNILLQESRQRKILRRNVLVKLRSYGRLRCRRFMRELELADFILVPSEFILERLLDLGIDRDRLMLCPYGVDPPNNPVLRTQSRVPGPLRFLFVGRVEAAKGIFYLLDAFAGVDPTRARLTVVGSIECGRKDLIPSLSNVTFTGPLSRENVWRAYAEADVYVMPSLFEGLSLTILEAMSAGLPVVASAASGGADLIEMAHAGVVVKAGSSRELREAIEWAIEHENEIVHMGVNATIVARQHTWTNYGDSIRTAFERIASHREAGRSNEA